MPSRTRKRPTSSHRTRQKRQVRHAIASGQDMPPVGFADRTSYFKTKGGGPTDSETYWSGPVSERATPWLQQTQGQQGQQPHPQQQGVSSGGSSLSVHDRESSPRLKTAGSAQSLVQTRATSRRRRRMKRPASASTISVLSMLEYERNSLNKNRRPKSSVGRNPRSRSRSQSRSRSHSSIQKSTARSTCTNNTNNTNNTKYRDELSESLSYISDSSDQHQSAAQATSFATTQPPLVIPTIATINNHHSNSSTTTTLESTSIASSMLSTEEQHEDEVPIIPTGEKYRRQKGETNQRTTTTTAKNIKLKNKKNKKSKKKKNTQKDKALNSNMEWATAFLGRVETRLEGEKEMYSEFIDALRHGDGTLGNVQTVAKAVLSNHLDLLQELDDYVLQSMVTRRKRVNQNRAKKSNKQSKPHQQLHTVVPHNSLQKKHNLRRKKKKHWNWILDVAKTANPTAMKKSTLARLQKIPNKIDPAVWKRPANSYPTGRYCGSNGGSGKFSTAYPMTNLELTILNASRCPGPTRYRPELIRTGRGATKISDANPKSDVDWIIYRSKQVPGPLAYHPKLPRNGGGASKISDANPKNYLEWAEYYSKQTPGPSDYDINLCL